MEIYQILCLIGVPSLCVSLSGAMFATIRKWAAQRAAEREGILAMLHDRVYAICMDCIEHKCITPDELRNLGYLYRAYHALDGNGTGTELYERAKHLPLKGDES